MAKRGASEFYIKESNAVKGVLLPQYESAYHILKTYYGMKKKLKDLLKEVNELNEKMNYGLESIRIKDVVGDGCNVHYTKGDIDKMSKKKLEAENMANDLDYRLRLFNKCFEIEDNFKKLDNLYKWLITDYFYYGMKLDDLAKEVNVTSKSAKRYLDIGIKEFYLLIGEYI